jgi:hypothetical protein
LGRLGALAGGLKAGGGTSEIPHASSVVLNWVTAANSVDGSVIARHSQSPAQEGEPVILLGILGNRDSFVNFGRSSRLRGRGIDLTRVECSQRQSQMARIGGGAVRGNQQLVQILGRIESRLRDELLEVRIIGFKLSNDILAERRGFRRIDIHPGQNLGIRHYQVEQLGVGGLKQASEGRNRDRSGKNPKHHTIQDELPRFILAAAFHTQGA